MEKAAIVDALKGKYPLPLLLKRLKLPKSRYYYQETALKQQDKYSSIRKRICALFHEKTGVMGIAGYTPCSAVREPSSPRRWCAGSWRKRGAKGKSRRKYNSYQGKISPSVPNAVNRDFHTEKPNEKRLTDITEFSIPAGKVYLSPIVDCFDGMLPYRTVSMTPDAALVNDMLDGAIPQLGGAEHSIVHSDRGCHYRWSVRISRMEKAGLERSMSKKGCSSDNSACEGLFGRLKNEMFYNRDWTGVSI